ncbi:hypothetical protein EDC04DRAFT_2573056 [Pisolithus marmoratus]|nr:hypothetical protein EDC04DRAFT_2573056 [Pisolithus marmoratus]
MWELVLKAWRDYFIVLKADLKKAIGRISFTSDIWSADSLNLHLAVTSHWIRQDKNMTGLMLGATLIAFHHLPSCHILQVIDHVEVTMENVSTQVVWQT